MYKTKLIVRVPSTRVVIVFVTCVFTNLSSSCVFFNSPLLLRLLVLLLILRLYPSLLVLLLILLLPLYQFPLVTILILLPRLHQSLLVLILSLRLNQSLLVLLLSPNTLLSNSISLRELIPFRSNLRSLSLETSSHVRPSRSFVSSEHFILFRPHALRNVFTLTQVHSHVMYLLGLYSKQMGTEN